MEKKYKIILIFIVYTSLAYQFIFNGWFNNVYEYFCKSLLYGLNTVPCNIMLQEESILEVWDKFVATLPNLRPMGPIEVADTKHSR